MAFVERRRFFRINDEVMLHCEKVGNEIANVEDMKATQSEHWRDLLDIDEKIQMEMTILDQKMPGVASLLKLLNEKIEIIVDEMHLSRRKESNIDFKKENVSLSACGVGLGRSEAIEKGVRLKIELVLLPKNIHVVLIGRVVECEHLRNTESKIPYFWRIDFTDVHPKDSEILIQHVIKKQSQQLHNSKMEKDASKKIF